ncbi:MAG: CinA family protein [Pseudomonadota bacterium]
MSAHALLDKARAAGVMLATAESCTGGLIAGALTDIPGASDVFDRAFVTYSNAAKIQMLGVDPAVIEAHGAVSDAVAQAMADGALARSDAGLVIAVTGVAGPGGSDRKPEGMVCFGLASAHHRRAETIQFGARGRSGVRDATVRRALRMMIAELDR